MVFKKISAHRTNLKQRIITLKKDYPKDSKLILEYLHKKVMENDISEKRQEKILSCFSSFSLFIKKDFSDVTKKDLENFKLSKKFAVQTLRDYVDVIRKFYEFKYNDKFREWELNKWFKVPRQTKTPEILNEQEIEKLYKSCKSNQERFLIAVLFDSGARAEEFLNIRFEDIIEPTQSFPYYKIDFKEEYSKTDGRTIGLYWKYSTEAIKNYLDELSNSDLKKPVYNKDYDSVRMFLHRLGKKVLNKRVHFHIFRKSSATYYANKDLGREKLCIRYGWKFSSNMVDVYIKRSGMKEDEIKDKILNTDMSILSKENQEIKTNFALFKENSEKEIEKLNEKINRQTKIAEIILKALPIKIRKQTLKIPKNLIQMD